MFFPFPWSKLRISSFLAGTLFYNLQGIKPLRGGRRKTLSRPFGWLIYSTYGAPLQIKEKNCPQAEDWIKILDIE
jgi:hypothetical protein